MKNYRRLLICLVVLFSGIAFAPALAFPWTEKVNWQQYAMIYQTPTVFYVNSTADEFDANVGDRVCATAAGACTLRAAIQEANAIYNDVKDVTVEVPAGVYTLNKRTSASRPYHISVNRYSAYNVVIHGQGPDKTIIQSDGTAGVFIVGYSAVFSGMTIQNGKVSHRSSYSYGWAGGVRVVGDSEITVINSIIQNNQGDYGGGISIDERSYLTIIDSVIQGNRAFRGGGIYTYTAYHPTIRRSTISHNKADSKGGGIFSEISAAYYNQVSTFRFENSTLSGNQAAYGGGWYNLITPVEILNSTISANTANNQPDGNAGGLFFDRPTGYNSSYYKDKGYFILGNTILASNDSPAAPDCYTSIASGLISNGYNLIGSTTGCDVTLVSGDLANRSAGLAPLSMNGGKTATHALLFGSPAIDGGDPAGCKDAGGSPLTVDQRGFARPRDGNGDGQAVCDIGAYETPRLYGVFLPVMYR